MTAATTQTLEAKSRTPNGKSEARRLRLSGLVPAIAYGKGLPATAIAVAPKAVATILRTELGKNTLIELDLEGKKLLAMIKDFTLHPLHRELEHVDFVEVKLDQLGRSASVPLLAIGKAVGVAKGGVLRVVHRLVPVRCLPNVIPIKIETDVTNLELGEHIATQDLEASRRGRGVVRLATQTPGRRQPLRRRKSKRSRPPVAGAPAVAGAAAPAAAGAAAPAADAKKDEKKGREEEVVFSGVPGRRPGQPWARVRGNPAQRRVHGGRRARASRRVRRVWGMKFSAHRTRGDSSPGAGPVAFLQPQIVHEPPLRRISASRRRRPS